MTITLLPIDEANLENLDAWLDSVCTNRELVSNIVAGILEMSQKMESKMPWGGYLALTTDRRLVGTCAFKSAPNEKQEVEIAYFTFPHYERLGVGTAMANALASIAKESAAVSTLLAHTLPAESASTAICRKIGLQLTGEVMDPEDGQVWRWVMPV